MADFRLSKQSVVESWNAFQLWFTKALRIAVVMVRGAYWMTERRRVLMALGARAFEQLEAGAIDEKALESDRRALLSINQRLQREEARIQALRFGEPEREHDE